MGVEISKLNSKQVSSTDEKPKHWGYEGVNGNYYQINYRP